MENKVKVSEKYSVDESGGLAVITLQVESLDIGNASEFRLLMEEVVNRNRFVILNLEFVQSMDSTGLGTLYPLRNQLNANSGGLMVANLTRKVKQLFKLVSADSLFDIVPDLETALSRTHHLKTLIDET